MKIGILGATGAVGKEMLKILEEKQFPYDDLKLFASEKSAGKKVNYCGKKLEIVQATKDCFKGLNVILGAVDNDKSRYYAPFIHDAGAIYVDNSSAFRLEKEVPLIIPQINPEDLCFHHGIIANPNCVTILGLMAIYPIHQCNPVKRISICTYQAVSGAGQAGMEELYQQLDALNQKEKLYPEVFSHIIACNVIAQIGDLDEDGISKEERKFENESRKILHNDKLKVCCSCVRVPVVRAHSMNIQLELSNPIHDDEIKEALSQFCNTSLACPTPLDASHQNQVYVGRVRKDLSVENGLVLWCCGDQLRKGAAYNAIEIVELLEKTQFQLSKKGLSKV